MLCTNAIGQFGIFLNPKRAFNLTEYTKKVYDFLG